MTYTTATFDDVIYIDQRLLPRRQVSPALRGALVIGLGAVAAVGVIGAMAAASMMFGPSHTAIAIAAKEPAAQRPAIVAAPRDRVAPKLASAVAPQRPKDLNWADLISNPEPLAPPARFEPWPSVASAPAAAPPASVASAPEAAPQPVLARSDDSPSPPVMNLPEIAPLPPVIARADIMTGPPAAGTPEIVPLPPVIDRADAALEPPVAGPRDAAPLPSVMVHSEPVPLPPRRPTEIASREPAPRPEPVSLPFAKPDQAVSPPLVQPSRETARQAPAPSPARDKPRVTDVAKAAPAQGQDDDRYPLQKFFSALTGSLRSSSGSAPAVGNGTALYDIAAHTVYLPNGERLEAHSGLGSNFDNPRSITEKNRGVTPPNVYQLSLRPQLFHGVAALRLTPTNENAMYGRVGMLAHTYMLGPRGDSNGCVSFRDYQRFLRAFQSGQISRLVVVTHSGAAPYSVASNGR